MRGSVGSVTGGAGAHDRHSRGPRAHWPMLPVQAAQQQSQRESLLQRGAGGVFLARLHHAGGLLCEDRFPVAEGVTGQAGPSQRTEIPTNRQEVLLCPLSVHHLLRALPHLPPRLHPLSAQRNSIL